MKPEATSPSRLLDEGSDPSLGNQNGRKKRRRCGACSPCLTKINCESCSNCLNRKTGHQICKLRKCIELQKKVSRPNSVLSEPNESEVKKEILQSTSPIVSSPEVTNGLPTVLDTCTSTEEAFPRISPPVFQDTAGSSHDWPCSCKVKDEGSVYKHLGAGSSIANLRSMLAQRFNISSEAIRIEQVARSQKEGRNRQGCPIARWVLRRSGIEEKILTVVRHRSGHTCEHAIVVLCIVQWEGIRTNQADELYSTLTTNLNEHATPTPRGCSTNESKQCACQGSDPTTCGASFSFGCAWIMYHNGCKFARSKTPRKFRMHNQEKEDFMDHLLQDLATQVAHSYKLLAPEAFENQTRHGEDGVECRVGYTDEYKQDARPFSGITCCVDFCAHNHRDKRNMDSGATVVLTLLGKTEKETGDEQLHSLPCYQLLDANANVLPPNYVIPKHLLKSPMAPHPTSSDDNNSLSGVTNHERKNENNNTLIFNGHHREKFPNQQYLGYYIPGEQGSEYCNNANGKLNGIDRNLYGFDNNERILPGYPGAWGQSPPGYSPMFGHPGFFMNGFHANGFTSNGFHNDVVPKQISYEAPVSSSNRATRNDEEETKTESSRNDDVNEDVTWIDDAMGGVGLALSHGSILIECAKQETHATTRVEKPNRKSPTRISLVFYQHKQLNFRNHGSEEYRKKLEQKEIIKKLDAQQAALDAGEEECTGLPFDADGLEMLAETALNYPNQELPPQAAATAGAHDSDVRVQDKSSNDTRLGEITSSTCTSTQGRSVDDMSSSNASSPNYVNGSSWQPLQNNPPSSFPLSELLRSLKHKETNINGFPEPVTPVYPTYPYTNNLPLTSLINPLFTAPPRRPNHVYSPFTPAGRGLYQLLNSHHLDQKQCHPSNHDEGTSDHSTTSHIVNGYSVEALLGQKRNHDSSSRGARTFEGFSRDARAHEGFSRDARTQEGFSRDARTHEGFSRDARTHEGFSRDARPHESFLRDAVETHETSSKQRKLSQNGFAHYGSLPNEQLSVSNQLLGLPFYSDMALNPSKLLRYGPFAPKNIFTGTTTHAIDSLVTMAPFSGTFVSGNYQW